MTNNNSPRVALIGNMNNNFFGFMRYLIDEGIDAHLFIYNSEMSHFSPESDSWNIEKYVDRIKQIPFGNPHKDLWISRSYFRKLATEFDVLIGCDYSAAYFSFAGVKLNYFIPYGSDIYEFPFGKLIKISEGNPFKQLLYSVIDKFVSFYQFKGIKQTNYVISSDIAETFRLAHRKLGINNIDVGVPMVYNERIESTNELFLPSEIKAVCQKISSFDFSVISQSRQYWTKTMDKAGSDTLKGNDLLIRGFAKFLKITQANAVLVLFQYGPDVKSSKELIDTLQLANNVIWVQKTERKYILYLLNKFGSIGADQFKSGYFGGTGYEILSQGIPLMQNIEIDKDSYESVTNKKFPPIINVSTEEEICRELVFYYNNPFELLKLKKSSKAWFDEYLGLGLAKQFAADIKKLTLLKRDKAILV